ncbi:MAG: glycoside hydrolase family 13 protein [Thermoleophilia bacterium]|nr:glycoside hydrolase family 13 protein [Thermoleophilia bacterium]
MTRAPSPPASWWRTAVVYQVYIRSFADADGDGMGDVAGIGARLPYLADLGVDAIWINPWYRSPQVDAGYDVADFRDIDPLFGTLAGAEGLIRDAHLAGLRVIVDVVPNHTSSEHAWFRAALAAAPGSPERARYLFRDGRGPGGDVPPNDWRSVFGGPAWTRVPDGQWYLHLFAPEQPDLDWSNPEVREEFLSVLEFWLRRGVDGFRVDVAHGLIKAPGLPDIGYHALPLGPHDVALPWHSDDHPHWNRAELHEVFRSWRALAARYGDAMFVAEAEVGPIERYADYVRPGELHSTFNFPFLKSPWDAAALREVIDRTVRVYGAAGAPPNWVLGNHDLTRVATRFADGDPARGLRRARAAALLMLGLPGGAYVYQGDELGIEEVVHFTPGERQDPIFLRSGGAVTGRDGCRVPLPWSGDEPPFWFSPPGAAAPWLRQPASWRAVTAERQLADPGSTLSLHRTALRVRRAHDGFRGEGFAWIDAPGEVLHFARGSAAVAVNLSDRPFPLPRGARVLVASAEPAGGAVPPDAAAWYEP